MIDLCNACKPANQRMAIHTADIMEQVCPKIIFGLKDYHVSDGSNKRITVYNAQDRQNWNRTQPHWIK